MDKTTFTMQSKLSEILLPFESSLIDLDTSLIDSGCRSYFSLEPIIEQIQKLHRDMVEVSQRCSGRTTRIIDQCIANAIQFDRSSTIFVSSNPTLARDMFRERLHFKGLGVSQESSSQYLFRLPNGSCIFIKDCTRDWDKKLSEFSSNNTKNIYVFYDHGLQNI